MQPKTDLAGEVGGLRERKGDLCDTRHSAAALEGACFCIFLISVNFSQQQKQKYVKDVKFAGNG